MRFSQTIKDYVPVVILFLIVMTVLVSAILGVHDLLTSGIQKRIEKLVAECSPTEFYVVADEKVSVVYQCPEGWEI